MIRSKFLVCFTTAAMTLSAFVVATMSCSKGKTGGETVVPTVADSNAYAEDYTIAEMVVNDVIRQADRSQDIASGSTMGYRTTAGCAAIVTSNLDSTIIDFGTTNCVGVDSRSRRGKIIVVHTNGHYDDSTFSHTIYMDNYFVNDNRATGDILVKNKGRNSFGQPAYTLTINATITRTNGSSISFNEIRTRTWTAGYNTQTDRNDDVYKDWTAGASSITRTVAGVSTTIKTNISEFTPLVVAFNCNWVKSGSVGFTLPSTTVLRTLNFGEGTSCDKDAVLELPTSIRIPMTLQ
jgi:hypothetical protein